MSDVILFGVLEMPYEMAMESEISRRQFYPRVQQAVSRLKAAEALVAEQVKAITAGDEEIASLKTSLEETQGRIDGLILAKAEAEARAYKLADLHVAQAVAGAVVASVESLETSESEARPLSTEQLAVALDAQGKLTEVYRDIAMAQAVAPVAATGEPFMYAIMGPDGKAFFDENCVDPGEDALFSVVNALNDSPDTGYTVVPVYLAAPQQHAQAALSDEQIIKVARKHYLDRSVILGSRRHDYVISFAREILATRQQEESKEPEHDVAVLLRLRQPLADGTPVHVVITKRRYEALKTVEELNKHDEFLYDDHTCPTNWLGVEYVIDGENCDPHGLFEHVQTIEIPQNEWGTGLIDLSDSNEFGHIDKLRGLFSALDPALRATSKDSERDAARTRSIVIKGDEYLVTFKPDDVTEVVWKGPYK